MKYSKVLALAGLVGLSTSAISAFAQSSASCDYSASMLGSWKALFQRQLKIFDKENSEKLTQVTSDIVDGQLPKFLIDMTGLDPNITLKLAGGPMSLLELAAAACQPEIAEELLRLGASVDGVGYSTPLVAAAAKGQDSLTELLVQNGAQVEKVDINGMTALEAAVRQRKITTTRVLLKYGSSPNHSLPNGGTILDIVAHSSDPNDREIAIELARFGAVSGLAGKGGADPPR